MLAMVIAAVLTGIAVPVYQNYKERARITVRANDGAFIGVAAVY